MRARAAPRPLKASSVTGESMIHKQSLYILSAWTLARREVVRFLRQRNRIAGALGTPIVFWLLMGSGLEGSFRSPTLPGNVSYLQYAFPGTLALILLFTSIFTNISVIEDRQTGFLQSVLVSPAQRSAVALGKILGSSVLASAQGVLFLSLGPLAGIAVAPEVILPAVGWIFLLAFTLSALGFWVAWKMESTQGFHAIMNLLLMPMWLLSGAVFPAAGASPWIQHVIAINPLTYGVAGLRHTLFIFDAGAPHGLPSLMVSLVVTVLFGLGTLLAASSAVRASRL